MMDHHDIRNDNGVDEDEDGDRDDLEWSSVARIYHKRWRMVQRLIPLFAEIRMQERTAAGLQMYETRKWGGWEVERCYTPPSLWDGVYWW